MSDAGEEQACRICRCGAEEESPLFHPCKCIGSIQYVHSDCLLEWLNHSRKKHCELCGHAFGFHKRYKPDMPVDLPKRLYLKRLAQRFVALCVMALRAVLVAAAWLALLPLGNIYTWRGFFWAGDLVVWCLKGGQPPWGLWQHSRSTAAAAAAAAAGGVAKTVVQNATGGLVETPEAIASLVQEDRFLAAYTVAKIQAANLTDVYKGAFTLALKRKYGEETLASIASTTQTWCPSVINSTYTLTCERLARHDKLVVGIIEEWPALLEAQMKAKTQGVEPTGVTKHVASSLVEALGSVVSMARLRRFAGKLARDCFEGQVLTCCVVIIFVAGFLFREWVLQNMPHHLDELEDPLPAPAAAQAAAAPRAADLAALQAVVDAARRDVDEARERVDESRNEVEASRRDLEAARLNLDAQDTPNGAGAAAEGDAAGTSGATQVEAGPSSSGGKEATPEVEAEAESDESFDLAEMRALRLQRFGSKPGAQSSSSSEVAAGKAADRIGGPRLETFIDTKYVAPYAQAQAQAQDGAASTSSRSKLDIFPPTPDETPTSATDKGKGKAREMDVSQASQQQLDEPLTPLSIASPSRGAFAMHQKKRRLSASSRNDEAQQHDELLTPVPDTSLDATFEVDSDEWSTESDEAAQGEQELAAALAKRDLLTHFDEGPGKALRGQFEEHEELVSPDASDDEFEHGLDQQDETETSVESSITEWSPRSAEEEAQMDESDDAEAGDWPMDEDAWPPARADTPTERPPDEPVRLANEANAPPRVVVRPVGPVRAGQPPPPLAVAIVAPIDEEPIDLGDVDVWAEEEADEALGPVENDFEGVMEAIGMQGPLVNLASNVSMMLVLCSVVLLVFVALPYVFGKLLGVKDFVKLVEFVVLGPIRLVRLVTDPFFDFVIRMVRLGAASTAKAAAKQVPTALYKSSASKQVKTPSSFNVEAVTAMLARIPLPSAARSRLDSTVHSLNEHHVSLKALPALLRHRFDGVFVTSLARFERLDRKTHGIKLSDRAFCVLLGWIYGTALVSLQSRLGAHLYGRSKVLEFVDQQLMLLKVVIFTIVELLLFPFACGALLDACLMPLWRDVNVAVRWMQLKNAPMSIGFTMWLTGTLWMYVFATFVSATRSVVRPGVMCWIRDSNDPSFHPIREIVERRSIVQIRKILVSGALYAGVIIATLGCSMQMCRLISTRPVPLEWRPHEALASTPFDLLALLFLLRPAVRYLKPEAKAAALFKAWWVLMANKLRLTSFLLGGRPAREEGRHVRLTWRARLLFRDANVDVNGRPIGTPTPGVLFLHDETSAFARVPADDHSAPGPLLIRTDEQGTPVTAAGFHALEKQLAAETKREADAAAASTSPPAKPKFIVVYLPPHFRLRLITLIVALWLSLCLTLVFALSAPLVLGRNIIQNIFGLQPLHDPYAWTLGAAVYVALLALFRVARKSKLRKKWRKGKLFKRSNLLRMRVRAAKFAKRAWIVTAFGVITPTLLGLTTEIYFIVAWRRNPAPGAVPEIALSKAWAYGLLEQRLILSCLHLIPLNGAWTGATRLRDFVQAVFELELTGLRRPQARRVTRRVFLPVVGVLLALLVGPVVAVAALSAAGFGVGKEIRWLRRAQRWIIWIFLMYHGEHRLNQRMESWTTSLRDENFLESTVLRDYSANEEAEDRGYGSSHFRAEMARLGVQPGPDADPIAVVQQMIAADRRLRGEVPGAEVPAAVNEAENVVPSSNASSAASEDQAAARVDQID